MLIGEVGGVLAVGEVDDGGGEDVGHGPCRGASGLVTVEQDQAVTTHEQIELPWVCRGSEQGDGGEPELVESEDLPGSFDDDERLVTPLSPVPSV